MDVTDGQVESTKLELAILLAESTRPTIVMNKTIPTREVG